jgi:hypothetical protein
MVAGLFVLSISFSIQHISAQSFPSSIVISEVNWAGSKSSTADEWVELANIGNEVIDLTGWSIWTVVGEPKQLINIQAGTISPRGTFLVANNGPDYQFSLGTSTLAIVPDVVDSSLSLSNSALKLEVRDATGQRIDVVGDGNKPFVGSTEPIVSMERVLSPIGLGDVAISWQASTAREHLDQDAGQQGTPTPSGNTVITKPSPITTSSPATSIDTTDSDQFVVSNLQSVVERKVTGVIKVEGIISVSERLYVSRTSVISDGIWSAELSLPAAFSKQLDSGDKVTVVAKVSRGSTPKLLLASQEDLIVKEHSQGLNPLGLVDVEKPALFQFFRIRGQAHPTRGVLELTIDGYTFHVTHRQGVSLPTIQNQDTVELTGLIVALDPLTIRVLSDDSVEVTPAQSTSIEAVSDSVDDSVSSQSNTANIPSSQIDEVDSALSVGDANAEIAVLPDEVNTTADSNLLLKQNVLGIKSNRRVGVIEQISSYAAIVSVCAILVLLGDSLWLRLKYKQQQ